MIDCNPDNYHICEGILQDYCLRNCHYVAAMDMVSDEYIRIMKSPLDKYLENLVESVRGEKMK